MNGDGEAPARTTRTIAMPNHPDPPRDERLALRLTADEKAIIERACASCGEDVSSLVRRAAVIEAKRILKRIETP